MKIYIGQSFNIEKRFREHCHLRQKDTGSLLYKSIKKHGAEAHTFEVLHELPNDVCPKVLDAYEIFFISQLGTNRHQFRNGRGLNLTDGGGGVKGTKHSSETLLKISQSAKLKMTPDRKEMLRLLAIGRSPESKENIVAGIRNRNKDCYQKIAAANTGKKRSDETKRKIGDATLARNSSITEMMKGNTFSKGRIVSDETKAKLSLAHKGLRKPKSEEWRKNQSEKMKGNQHRKKLNNGAL